MRKKKICIVGIGNTLRSDDGVGAYVANAIALRHLQEVDSIIVQQLQTELLEELIDYKTVIIVDAAVMGKGWIFERLEVDETKSQSTSHHVNAHMFVALAKQLYRHQTQFYYCAVRGVRFEMGEQISPTVVQHANEAVEEILRFILSGKG